MEVFRLSREKFASSLSGKGAALKGARNKLQELQRDFDAWEETTVGADFPKGE